MAQLKEIKRLTDLKVEKDESEEQLKKLLNPATIKAQALKWEEHESKFEWVLNRAKKLGLPPPSKLKTFGMTAEDKKGKRTEFLKKSSSKSILRWMGLRGTWLLLLVLLSVEEPLSAGLRGDEDQLSAKHQLVVKGLSKCKA
ncbi:hypothetical protein Tco_0488430 [Tanacetum coccineum]